MKNISKLIIGAVIILAIGAVVLIRGSILSKEKKIEEKEGSGFINLQFYGSYEVEASGIREYFSLLDDVPLIGFFQIRNAEHLYEKFPKALDFKWPDDFDFDFADYQDKRLVITFGRQLVDIWYEYRKDEYYENVPFTEIIFTEEHHDQTMYVYIMDNMRLWPADLSGYGYNSFCVMNGTEKVFIGDDIQSFNLLSPNFKEGI